MSSVTLDRRVLLALCARDILSSTNALTAAEAWRLIDLLGERGMRPGDLIDQPDGVDLDGRLGRRLTALDQVDALVEHYARREIWILTPVDPDYPARLGDRLRMAAPALIYGAGPPSLLADDGVGVVGSRDLGDEAITVTDALGRAIAGAGVTLISGGARGADQIAMGAATQRGGSAVGVLVHPLEREAQRPDARQLMAEQRLCLVSPFKPSAGFRPANAMARNKIIYALARCTAVIASDEGKGGTWAGATEALRRSYGPVAVWTGAGAGPGNPRLIERGAQPFGAPEELLAITRNGCAPAAPGADQLRLGV